MRKARLFDLMAQRETARAARAGMAFATARRRAIAAEVAADRLSVLLSGMARTGPVTAADLAALRRLGQELAAEHGRQRDLAAKAMAEAQVQQRALIGHDRRRAHCIDMARADRKADAEDAQAQFDANLPPSRRRE